MTSVYEEPVEVFDGLLSDLAEELSDVFFSPLDDDESLLDVDDEDDDDLSAESEDLDVFDGGFLRLSFL